MAKKTLSFEQQLNRLEEIVGILDEGNIPLDEMLKIYEEGMNLASEMKNYLEKAEQKVIDISKKKNLDAET
jgi:exodeoxyribonuclease VII small subunit